MCECNEDDCLLPHAVKEPDCPMCGDAGYVSPNPDYDVLCSCDAGKHLDPERYARENQNIRGNVTEGEVLKGSDNPDVFPLYYSEKSKERQNYEAIKQRVENRIKTRFGDKSKRLWLDSK